MEKNILMELSRIKGLINYNISNGFLIEEDSQGAEIRQRAIDNKILGTDNVKGGGDPDSERWPSITLSNESTEYPIIFPYPNGIPILGDKETGKPIVWQFKAGDSSKTFISEKQFKILVGSVEAADKTIKENQEYFEKNGIKYCLPQKEWWDLHTDKKYIYKFQNPRNNKIFNMKLTMLGEGQCTNSGDGIKYSGLDCSKRCMGANNGWAFSLDGFFESGTGKGYDPEKNTDHFDLRSIDDIFWDKYDIWIEVAVGVAVAIAAPYLAAGILGIMATPILAATRIARLVTFLGQASLYGGETTVLIVLCEVAAEAGLLSPLIYNYLSRGDNANAYLTMAMCLIPFVIEIPSVKSFISKGFGNATMAESVVSKIKTSGGLDYLLTLSKEEQKALIKSILTKDEQTMFYLAMELLAKDDGVVLQKAFAEFIAKNGDRIEGGIARGTGNAPIDTGYKDWLKNTGYKALEIVANPIGSALLQRSFVTSLVRGFIVVGPIVIAFKYTWGKAAEWMTETQKDDVQNKIQDILNGNGSSYGKALMELNESLGLGKEIPQEVVNLTIKKLIEDPTFTKFDENTEALIEEKTKESIKEVVEQQLKNIAEVIKKSNTNSTEDLKRMELFDAQNQLSVLDEIIMSSGYPTLPDWENDSPTLYDEWKFSVIAGGKEINGVVKFINGDKNYEVYVDTKKIFPTDDIKSGPEVKFNPRIVNNIGGFNNPPKTTNPKTKGVLFIPSGYNTTYNENDEIWQDGNFKDGQLYDGKVYEYDRDGILQRIKVYKEGKYHSEGQL